MRKYLVIYEKAPRNYSAYCPDLPGCIAVGRTRREVEKNMKEAIQFHLDGFQVPPSPPSASSSAGYVIVRPDVE
jgi:predicted RNase H-like HicB family nuclease